jgi:hypothetical protein
MLTVSSLKSFGAAFRMVPFLLLRILVFFGVALGLALAILCGAWIVQRVQLGLGGDLLSDLVVGALIGGAVGVLVLATQRNRLLHAVDAGVIALMVDWLDRRRLPIGLHQIGYARTRIAQRFGSRSELGALDRLVRGVAARVPTMSEDCGVVLSVPGLARPMTGGLVEAGVLAHAYATRPENAWEAAHDGLVLFAQNARTVLEAASWINVAGWLATLSVFLFLLPPISGLAPLWPVAGHMSILVLAGLGAWAVRAALIVPVMVASFIQVFRQITAHQDPSHEWQGRLTQVCDRFRQLGDRAIGWMPKGAPEL